MAGECDRKHIGCEGSDGPLQVGRARFTFNSDGTSSYAQDYLVSSPLQALTLLNQGSSEIPNAIVTSVSGRQDSCGEWVATAQYTTPEGADFSGGGGCPPDEITISGTAIQSSWTKHPCFDQEVSGNPFNGLRPYKAWGSSIDDSDVELQQFDYDSLIFSDTSTGKEASKRFAGSEGYYVGSYEVTVTEYFAGTPPTIDGIIGTPAQPPGFPITNGMYGFVMTGSVYQQGDGNSCARRVLVYLMSKQPWPHIDQATCTVVDPV